MIGAEVSPKRGVNRVERLYTVDEAAEALRLTPQVIRQLLRERRLRAAKIGRMWRIKESDLNAFFEENVPGGKADDVR